MSQVFQTGDFAVDEFGRHCIIKGVRDDTYEQRWRRRDARHGYYYHVEYNDGKFNTYIPGYNLTLVQKKTINK